MIVLVPALPKDDKHITEIFKTAQKLASSPYLEINIKAFVRVLLVD
jgi:hypothetical protein